VGPCCRIKEEEKVKGYYFTGPLNGLTGQGPQPIGLTPFGRPGGGIRCGCVEGIRCGAGKHGSVWPPVCRRRIVCGCVWQSSVWSRLCLAAAILGAAALLRDSPAVIPKPRLLELVRILL
jgi:hypothetical protein